MDIYIAYMVRIISRNTDVRGDDDVLRMLQVDTQLASLNALHSNRDFSTLMGLVILIRYSTRHYFEAYVRFVQTKMILTPIWPHWMPRHQASLITAISRVS